MKTIHQARRMLKLRVWAGTVAVLVLASAEVWMVCHVGHDYGQITTQPPVQVPGIADWFAGN